ncbi:hypothetical protein A2U01_0090331, partial [Trifolium medium]|nr:hypothetical protein [Trifolium medium]
VPRPPESPPHLAPPHHAHGQVEVDPQARGQHVLEAQAHGLAQAVPQAL